MPRKHQSHGHHHGHHDHHEPHGHGRRSHRQRAQEELQPDYSRYGYHATGQTYEGRAVYANDQGQQFTIEAPQRGGQRGGRAQASWGGSHHEQDYDQGEARYQSRGRGSRHQQPAYGQQREPDSARAYQQVADNSNSWFGGLFGGGSGGRSQGGGNGNVAAAAQRYYGMGETTGNNRGPDIGYFHRGTGAGQGDAWCASYVTTVAQDAGLPIRKTASVANLAGQYAQHGAFRNRSYIPQKGDMVFMNTGPTGRHVGIVQSVDASGGITTTEGNAGGFPSRVQDVYHSAADVARRVTGYGDTAALTGGGGVSYSGNYASMQAPQTPNMKHRRGHHHGRS